MRFLHTSDWHVGKTLKGQSRLDEHHAVLREIVDIAREYEVDAVLIAGDLYETAAPSAEAQRLVVQALLALRNTGAQVIAIAGNHDHQPTFDAYRPLMGEVGITLIGQVRPADKGGLVEFTARSTGEPVIVAVLPFVHQRYAVNAAELVTNSPADNAASYDQMVRDILAELTTGFRSDAVNVLMAHLTVTGGVMGGGERSAQSIFEYHIPATAFPVEAHYVALGHLHRRQQLPAACPVHYSGSPLAVDFGEQDNTHVVCIVDASPTTPARVTDVPLKAGRRLRTVAGTVAELIEHADEFGDDFLRVWVREPRRAGLAEDVQEALPNALEVRIHPDFAAPATASRPSVGIQLSPAELFGAFCGTRGVADRDVEALFARLHDQVTGSDATQQGRH
jgi:exonuclease SbcD